MHTHAHINIILTVKKNLHGYFHNITHCIYVCVYLYTHIYSVLYKKYIQM